MARSNAGRSRRGRPDDPEPRDRGPREPEPDADPESVARSVALQRLSVAPQTRAQLDAAMARKGVPEEVRDGVLEDQLAAPLVTLDGAAIGGQPTTKFDDKSLWGNNV